MNERSFAKAGLPLGRIKGIQIRIHWLLLLWFGYVLYLGWVNRSGWHTLLQHTVWWVSTFTVILIHELGHCYAAYRQGGGADMVVLWPLGGLAYCDAPRLPWNQFWVAAGGPLAQLLPTALAGGLILFLGIDASLYPRYQDSYLAVALGGAFWWSLIILPFNLIPMYPLDGGRMFHSIVWGRLGSYGRATIITIWTSRIAILLCFLLDILFLGRSAFVWPAGCVLLWAFLETEKLRVRLQAGEDSEDYVFGYDFSRGYTSLERTAVRERPKARPGILERLRMRSRENRRVREAELRRKVDGLLEKISREGLPSLTRRERRFLELASKRLR